MSSKARVAGAVFLTGAMCLMGGCGYKNNPVPPDAVVPGAIEDLHYSISAQGVRLQWSYPEKTIRGTELTDIGTFEVYRAVVSMDDYCGTCPIPFGAPITVPGGAVDTEKGRQGRYETALLRPGNKYFFKVNSRTSWWAASQDSNIVSFVWHIPAKAPDGLMGEAADSSVTISWLAVTKLMDETDLGFPVRYQVLRKVKEGGYRPLSTPQKATHFSDRGLTNGVPYSYKIQAILMVDGNPVAGGVSPAVQVLAIDQTAPSPPTGITAVETSAGIKVFWEKSQAADLKGYRIYRRSAGQQTAQRIGEVSGFYSIFEDVSAVKGGSYLYSITAFDQMDPPNESERSSEASSRH